MKIFVGVSSFRGNIRRFGFDLLELPVGATLPRPKTLAEYRSSRPDVAMSFRLHPDVIFGGDVHEESIERVQAAARAAEAAFIVVPTGPRFSPTPKNRERLQRLVDQLRGDSQRVAWEPRGVWAGGEAQKWADEVGVTVVADLTREDAPAGDVVYTRLLPLGFGARVTENGLTTLADRLEGYEEAYVVIQGEGAKGARNRLREWFEQEEGQ